MITAILLAILTQTTPGNEDWQFQVYSVAANYCRADRMFDQATADLAEEKAGAKLGGVVNARVVYEAQHDILWAKREKARLLLILKGSGLENWKDVKKWCYTDTQVATAGMCLIVPSAVECDDSDIKKIVEYSAKNYNWSSK